MKKILLLIVSLCSLWVIQSCEDEPLVPSSTLYPTSFQTTITIDTVLAADLITFKLNGFSYRARLWDCKCFDTILGPELTAQAESAKISTDSALKLGKAALNYAKSYLSTKKFAEVLRDSAYQNLNAKGELIRRLNYDSVSYYAKLKSKGFLAP